MEYEWNIYKIVYAGIAMAKYELKNYKFLFSCFQSMLDIKIKYIQQGRFSSPNLNQMCK